jgi:hypothetical protein
LAVAAGYELKIDRHVNKQTIYNIKPKGREQQCVRRRPHAAIPEKLNDSKSAI